MSKRRSRSRSPRIPLDPFNGRWTSTDIDGSRQRMRITWSGNRRNVRLVDQAGSVCGGRKTTAEGPGRVRSKTLLRVRFDIACEGGGGLTGVKVTYRYQPDADTLIDDVDGVWSRA